MIRVIALLAALTLSAAPALAQIQLDANVVGNGPYYLDQEGATYTLVENVTTLGAAFVFAAENITLDMNGHTVTFGESGAMHRYGVAVPPPYPHVAPRWSRSDITRWERAIGAVIMNGRIVQGAGRADSCFALGAMDQSNLTVRNNTIVIYGTDTHAIQTEGINQIFVYGNEITDNTDAVTNRHQGRAAIDVIDSANGPIEIFNNTIHNCRQWGVRLSRGANASAEMARVFDNDIFPNTIVTNGYAIGVHGNNVEVFGNTIVAENGRGIHVGGVNVVVHDNYIEVIEQPHWEEYTRVSAHGIKLEKCYAADVYNNTVISKGIVNDRSAIGNGAALSISVYTGSNNRVHDNQFISRHLGGTLWDPGDYGLYAVPVEVSEIQPESGLRLENNIFQSNDRFFALVSWLPPVQGTIADGSSAFFKGNTFRRDTATPYTGREEILLQASTVQDVRFIDCVFEDGVDLRRYKAGWPWTYCSWNTSWSGVVRVLDDVGAGVPGVPVQIRDRDGVLAFAGTSDAVGNLPVVLDQYIVSTVGADLEHIADTLYTNPHEIRAILATGPVSQSWTADRPYFVVNLLTDGSGGVPEDVLPVTDIDWAFRVLTTSPAPGATAVSPGAEIRFLFSHGVEQSGLSAGAIAARGSLSGNVSGSWVLVMGGRLLLFRPEHPLAVNETVTVSVSGGVSSVGGRTLDGNEDGIAEGNVLDDFRFQFLVGTAGGD